MGDLAYTNILGDLTVTGDSRLLSEKTYITGNVGINITDPLDMLDVGGDIRITGSLKTRSSILDLKDAAGNLVPTRVASLTVAPSSSYTAPSSGMYVHSRIGIGMSPSSDHSLDALGNIRLGGQLISTYNSTSPPFMVSSNLLVQNLNSDRLDGYHAMDMFNGTIEATGHGVLEGMTVQPVTAAMSVTVNSGRFILKDRGIVNFATQSYTGFTAGSKHIVFIAGKSGNEGGKTNLVQGQIAIAASTDGWPDMSLFTNPIILCRVDIPSGVSVMSSSYIYADRTMPSIKTVPSGFKIFRSDNINVSVQSGSYQTYDRVSIEKVTDSTRITVSNVPNPSSQSDNVLKTLQITPDQILFNRESVTQSVDASKIVLWDDSSSKRHTHIYDSDYVLSSDIDGNAVVTITSQQVVDRNFIRVYVNGMRKKEGQDYVIDSMDPRIIRFVHPISSTDDAIVIDYDTLYNVEG